MLAALALALSAACGDPEESFFAPADRWFTRGGSAAHSGASRARGLRGPVERVWTHDAEGEIEGEPLVWDDLIVLAVRKSDARRCLQAIDRVTGKRLVPDHNLESPVPLEPSLWRTSVVFRNGANQLRAVRVGQSRMGELWSFRSETPLGPPLLLDDRIVVAAGDALRCFSLSRKRETWSLPGAWSGSVALGPGGLCAVRTDGDLRLLVWIDPADGSERGTDLFPPAAADLQSSGHDIQLALMPSGTFARFALPNAPEERAGCTVLGVDPGASFETESAAAAMRSLPALAGTGWITHALDRKLGVVLARWDGKSTTSVLASRERAPELVTLAQPATVCGSIAYVGPLAFDLETLRVLWRVRGIEATHRPVPARETVLLVDRGRSLVAVRATAARARLASAELSAGKVQGTLVSRDGSIERGEFEVDPAGARVLRNGKGTPTSWAVADVLLLEDSGGRIVLASDPVRALQLLAETQSGESYLELAKRARQANAPDQLESLLDRAAAHGIEEKSLASLRALVETQRKSKARANAEAIAKIEAEAQQVTHLPTELIWEHVQALDDAQRAKLAPVLLRALLELRPDHEHAREAVRALLPEKLRPSGAFDALDALAMAEALRRTKVEVVLPPEPGTADVTFAQREVGKRQPHWRKDLYAIHSDDLLIVTPVRKLGSLARCLALGELVGKTLSEFFPERSAERDTRYPMVIELCETKDEYARRAAGKGGNPAELQWTAGLYDAADNVTRLYLPDGDDEFESALATVAHEMTHHWLRLRCPAWPFRPLSANPGDAELPGFWVVEGFASFVEGFGFDLESGSWSLGGAQSPGLDVVANAPLEKRLPWSDLYRISHVDFAVALPKEGRIAIPSSIYLGSSRVLSPAQIFYSQAEATVRYLYEGEGGVLRPKLFDFLRAYYTGDRAHLDLPKELGIEADELGASVAEHARQV